jgi:CRISPR-associated protein Cas1
MGWALRKERAAAVDGRPVLVLSADDRPEHVRFTLNGVAWREAAERWRWRAHTDWNTLALAGHGVRLSVDKDRLRIAHGHTSSAGAQVDSLLYRGQHGVQCIVLMASSGSITLDALQWCRDQHICLLVIDRDGHLVTVMTPPAPENIQLRIAQYRVDALPIAKCLVAWKLRECGLVRPSLAEAMHAHKGSCDRCPTLDWVRVVEAQAALAYWSSWNVGLWWKDREVPPHWRTFDQRESPLSRTGRHATHPVNAMLNYSYAVLAGRIERATVARGLDAAMGHLHAPKDGRASLVYDLIEPLRPTVDQQILTWVAGEQWRLSDFVVDRSGVVRLHPELARVVVQAGSVAEDAIGAVLDWYIGQLRALTDPVREEDKRSRTRRHGRRLGLRGRDVLLGSR